MGDTDGSPAGAFCASVPLGRADKLAWCWVGRRLFGEHARGGQQSRPGVHGDSQAQGIAGASDPERLVEKIPVNQKGGRDGPDWGFDCILGVMRIQFPER